MFCNNTKGRTNHHMLTSNFFAASTPESNSASSSATGCVDDREAITEMPNIANLHPAAAIVGFGSLPARLTGWLILNDQAD